MDGESASEGTALQKGEKEKEQKGKSELKEGVERILKGLPQFAGVCVCVCVCVIRCVCVCVCVCVCD